MRLGYYGGSFDPPHRGHLAVACAARDRFHLDEVLLVPTGRQPLKPSGPSAPYTDRLHMTELLCSGERGLTTSTLEAPVEEGVPNYTVDTLRRLRAGLTDPISLELFAITGIDTFLGLPRWRSPEELLRLATWIVVSRPGTPMSSLDELPLDPEQRGRIFLLQDVAEPVSATLLRQRLARGEDCTAFLPRALLRYIEARGLYRDESPKLAGERR